jgi:hypothetical protein
MNTEIPAIFLLQNRVRAGTLSISGGGMRVAGFCLSEGDSQNTAYYLKVSISFSNHSRIPQSTENWNSTSLTEPVRFFLILLIGICIEAIQMGSKI